MTTKVLRRLNVLSWKVFLKRHEKLIMWGLSIVGLIIILLFFKPIAGQSHLL